MNLPILKYYIGHTCEFITNTGQRFIHELTGHIYEVLKSGDTTYVSVKPVVRRLAAMTEDEAFDFCRSGFYNPSNIKSVTKYNDGVQFTYLEGDSKYLGYFGFNLITPAQFDYLLSRSFDLFNLLDKGEGIEADNLKENV